MVGLAGLLDLVWHCHFSNPLSSASGYLIPNDSTAISVFNNLVTLTFPFQSNTLYSIEIGHDVISSGGSFFSGFGYGLAFTWDFVSGILPVVAIQQLTPASSSSSIEPSQLNVLTIQFTQNIHINTAASSLEMMIINKSSVPNIYLSVFISSLATRNDLPGFDPHGSSIVDIPLPSALSLGSFYSVVVPSHLIKSVSGNSDLDFPGVSDGEWTFSTAGMICVVCLMENGMSGLDWCVMRCYESDTHRSSHD